MARARLICLPHAGGTASFFRSWNDHLPPDIELASAQYPGREDRIDEGFPDDMDCLVTAIAAQMSAFVDKPYLLFGHSMGAAIAYELCLAIARLGHRLPTWLVVSAKEAPEHHGGDAWHRASDAALCAELIRLGGVTAALLDHSELRALILPMVRNDYRLIETYQPSLPGAAFPAPIGAFYARDDTEVSEPEVVAWASCSPTHFVIRAFDGGHFYLREQGKAVVELLCEMAGWVSSRDHLSTP